MTGKEAKKTRPAKKSVTKVVGKKAKEKVLKNPRANKTGVKNPENKMVWKRFGM